MHMLCTWDLKSKKNFTCKNTGMQEMNAFVILPNNHLCVMSSRQTVDRSAGILIIVDFAMPGIYHFSPWIKSRCLEEVFTHFISCPSERKHSVKESRALRLVDCRLDETDDFKRHFNVYSNTYWCCICLFNVQFLSHWDVVNALHVTVKHTVISSYTDTHTLAQSSCINIRSIDMWVGWKKSSVFSGLHCFGCIYRGLKTYLDS